MVTLVSVLKKIENQDVLKYNTFYLHSEVETIVNESEINNAFESIYTAIISNKQKSLGKGSGWITDLDIENNINIWKYNPLAGRSYVKLAKELDCWIKMLINIQNIDDNECFKCCLVRYLNPADRILQ